MSYTLDLIELDWLSVRAWLFCPTFHVHTFWPIHNITKCLSLFKLSLSPFMFVTCTGCNPLSEKLSVEDVHYYSQGVTINFSKGGIKNGWNWPHILCNPPYTVSPKRKYTLLSCQVLKTEGGQMESPSGFGVYDFAASVYFLSVLTVSSGYII